MDLMRAQLDQLLGRDRNAVNEEQAREAVKQYYDPKVCKFYLLEFCPHDLFPNTKVDLGVCPRLHERYILDDFKKKIESGDSTTERHYLKYEEELLKELTFHIQELDRTIKKRFDRLDKGNTEGGQPSASLCPNPSLLIVIR